MNGALVSAPNIAGVSVSTISRIGTRMSARLPVTWTLREPRIGEVTVVDRICAWRSSSEGWAFIGGAPVSMQAGEPCFAKPRTGVRVANGLVSKRAAPVARIAPGGEAPYTGANRIRFQGSLSADAVHHLRHPRFKPPLKQFLMRSSMIAASLGAGAAATVRSPETPERRSMARLFTTAAPHVAFRATLIEGNREVENLRTWINADKAGSASDPPQSVKKRPRIPERVCRGRRPSRN